MLFFQQKRYCFCQSKEPVMETAEAQQAGGTPSHRDVALLVIGDEVLHGDVDDQNTPFLARWLMARGIPLRRVVTVGDTIDEIVSELNRLRALTAAVFTSGGLGPTHDDVTVEAVAAAFGVPVETDPAIAERIRAHYGERLKPAHLQMARVPAGASAIFGAFRFVPVIRMQNVFLLPGVPWLFRTCCQTLSTHFTGTPFCQGTVYLTCGEGRIAEELRRIQAAHPAVAIGSYPLFEQQYPLKLHFVGRIQAEVDAVATALRAAFGPYLAPENT
jgi:molybdenum cofactor synthesis domain-containing protein